MSIKSLTFDFKDFMDFRLEFMSLLQEAKLICKEYDIMPSRERGQNFLVNEEAYQQIIETASLLKKDNILEVGPGLGILTRLLCKSSAKVFAVEIDKKIFGYLKVVKELEGLDNLELLNQNILDLKIADFPVDKFKVVANLPYNITSIFLRKFLPFLASGKINEMVLMLQKEVAQRIASKPGQMSLLSLSAQFYGNAEIIDYVDRNNFWPEPKVDSAIIKLAPISGSKDKSIRGGSDEKVFFQVARIGFSAKRKKLANNLANGLHKEQAAVLPILQEIGLNNNTRAQELSVEQWIDLANLIKN